MPQSINVVDTVIDNYPGELSEVVSHFEWGQDSYHSFDSLKDSLLDLENDKMTESELYKEIKELVDWVDSFNLDPGNDTYIRFWW